MSHQPIYVGDPIPGFMEIGDPIPKNFSEPCKHVYRHLKLDIRILEGDSRMVDVFYCQYCLEYKEIIFKN